MKGIYWRIALILLLGFSLLGNGQASDTSLSRSVDGIDIHMGITHSNYSGTNFSARKMAMLYGLKGKKHHLTVALFDSASGQRITDAKVIATIGEMALSGNRKRLKQESFGDAVSYGRDFYLSKEGPYWIDLKIKRDGMRHATVARFEWDHY